MHGTNQVRLLGRIEDIKIKKTRLGEVQTILKLCERKEIVDKDTSQRMIRTQYHKIILPKRLTTLATQAANEGSYVLIEGEIYTRHAKDIKGEEHAVTEIVANTLQTFDLSFNPLTRH